MHRVFSIAASITIAVSLTSALGGTASAHERRNVGPYQFVVGWLAEPAFQGEANAASVRITDTRTTPPKAIEGLEKTLAIEVRSGGLAPHTGTVRSVFGQPGLYALDLIPTVAGSYSFRISGKVESLDVNEVFESGPGRFDEVKEQASLQYPVKAPVGEDLSARLDAIAGDVRTAQVIAILALIAAVALPLGVLLLRGRARS